MAFSVAFSSEYLGYGEFYQPAFVASEHNRFASLQPEKGLAAIFSRVTGYKKPPLLAA
ncbi:hypothetical protein [Candidatus Pantoea deserta]|uniref:hypothetical protein n=1 Tax=Candidatus Pantoea deserta TaxID=1869313 RepID=UPI00131A0470|nr:hypothetical protein [Pantoea deserta]